MHIGRLLIVASPLLLAVTAFGQVAPSYFEEAVLFASDAATGDGFGLSIAVSGDTAVVGSPYDRNAGGIEAGSAYVFVRSGTDWIQQAKLTAADGAAGDEFGYSVGLSDDTVVVGVPWDDNAGGVNAGSAYVFVRSGTSWSQQAKLTAEDATPADAFGFSAAISADTVVVGAVGGDSPGTLSSGSAYVYVRSGTSWNQQSKLTASDAMQGQGLGCSSAVSGDTVVVGAKGDTAGVGIFAGAAYVFERKGSVWYQDAKLTFADPELGDMFGGSVAVSGNTLVIGAYGEDTATGLLPFAGAAYIYVRGESGWSQQAKLVAPDPAQGKQFGASVGLSANTAVIGAFGEDTVGGGGDIGSAYVFVRNGALWTQQSKLTASDGDAGDSFGVSVAVSGETTAIGAHSNGTAGTADVGSAYIMKLVPIGTWQSVGPGLSGMAGVPSLAGSGTLLMGLPVALALERAKPVALAPLVVGLSNLSAPFKGGLMVPSPNLIFPLFTDALGGATFGGIWPAGIPSGFTTYFQWWIQDPAGPKGFAASNAVAGTTP